MIEYRIKVMKQNRILLSILTVAILLPFCILLSAKLELILFKIIIPILILGIVITLLYYFSFGQLRITLNDRKLDFEWKEKPVFNFKKYNSILIDDIKKVIVDQGIIVKIKTDNTEMEIRGINSEYIKSDHTDSLELLKLLEKEINIKPIDSWDVWNERGWLKIAYRINFLILISVILIVITYIILKGFNSKLLLLIPLVLSQLIFSYFQMKSKLK
tara:strand:+ start:61 stop:708 length:648 start_codon:yes stop_codon:yes gene_type:complete